MERSPVAGSAERKFQFAASGQRLERFASRKSNTTHLSRLIWLAEQCVDQSGQRLSGYGVVRRQPPMRDQALRTNVKQVGILGSVVPTIVNASSQTANGICPAANNARNFGASGSTVN